LRLHVMGEHSLEGVRFFTPREEEVAPEPVFEDAAEEPVAAPIPQPAKAKRTPAKAAKAVARRK
jgi:hypothetical protein